MRWLKRTLLILLPMVIILAIGALVLLRSERINKHVRDLLTEQLTESIEREVDIKSAELVRLGVLRLDGVRVAGESPKSPPLLRARTVDVRFGWRALVFGRQPAISTIERITVTEPEANVIRRPDGRWEIEDLLKPRKPPRGRFQGAVKLVRGRATIRDYAAPGAEERPAVNHIDQVSASVTVTPDRTTLFSISGRGRREMGDVRVSGVSRSDRLAVDARVAEVALPDVWRYLNLGTAVAVEAGRGDAEIHFSSTPRPRGRGRQIDYFVTASIRDAHIRVPSISAPFTSVNGRLVVAPDCVGFSGLRARLGRSELEVEGTVTRWKDPVLLLRARADDARVKDLLAATPRWSLPKWILQPQAVSFEASVAGPWRDPEVEGTARWGHFGIGPARWAEGRSPFRYHHRRIEAADLTARGDSGTVHGKGWVSWATPVPRAAFRATVSGAALAPLAARLGQTKPAISGLVSGSLTIAYDRQGLRVLAPVAVTEAKVDRVEFDRIETVAKYDAGSVDISGTHVHTKYGDIFVEGGFESSGELSLLVLAGDVDFASLSELIGQSVSGGRGYLLAHVGGSLREPSVVVSAGVVDAEIRGEEFGLLTADLGGDARTLEVADVRAWWRGGEISAAGEIRDIDYRRRRATLDLGVDIARLPLAELAAGARPGVEAEGILTGHLDVAGSIANPQVAGEILVERPMIAGQILDSAHAQVVYRDRTFNLDGALTVDGRERAAVKGTVDTGQQVALTFTVDDYPLRDLRIPVKDRQLAMSGALHGSGEVGGTLRRPTCDLQLRVPQLAVDGQDLHDVAVTGTWAQEKAAISDFAVGIDRGTIEGRAVVDVGARQFDAEVSADALSLARLLDWGRRGAWSPAGLRASLEHVPRSIDGALSAEADLEGDFKRPTGKVTINIGDAEMAGHSLPTLTAQASVEGTVVTVDDLTATEIGGPAEVTASGTIDLAGDVAMTVDAHNINAGLFAPWLRDRVAVGGSADVSADVTGPLRAPVVTGSMEVAQPQIGPVGFDDVQVAMFTIDRGRFSIPEDGPMVAVREGRAITASGALPFVWRSPVFPPDQPLDLRVQMPDGDLNMFASLVPGLAAVSGPVSLDLRLGGTLGQPQLEGNLAVADGRMEFMRGVTPLVGLKADIAFEGDRIRVAALSGTIGGGRVWVEPEGTIEMRHWSLTGLHNNAFNLTLRVDRAVVAYNQIGSVVIDARLPVTNSEGGEGPAQIAGEVTVIKGSASALPAVAEPQVRAAGPLPFDPELGIALAIAPNLAIKTAAMNIVLRGDGRLGGTLGEPDAVLTLAIDRGIFSFPAATFRFQEGLIDVVAMTGEAVRATIAAHAEARVRQHHVYLDLSGSLTDPKIDMQSVPYLSDEEILALLTGREVSPFATGGMTPQQALQSEFRTLLTAGLRQVVLSPVEREIAESIGLTELTFEFGPYNQPVVVRAGTFLGDRLYLQHVRALGGVIASSLIRGSYQVYLVPPIWLGLSIDERQTKQWELETHFPF